MREMTDNPVCANIFAAGFVRTIGSTIVTAYTPVFFQRVFPGFKAKYAMLNAMALIGCGISSSLLGGIISDKFEKKSYMTKANIIMTGNVLSIPLVAMAVFSQNFYFAMIAFALKIFVSGSYQAPAITMMQNTTRPSDSGLVVSVYTFFAYLAQTLSPLFFQGLARYFNAAANPRIYGFLVLAATSVGYLGSNIFYRRAGKEYTKMMIAKDEMAESCELDPEMMEADVLSIKSEKSDK